MNSSDGWEVSLVSFIIPNADSSNGDPSDSSLFGVSLVFVKNSNTKNANNEGKIKTEYCFDTSDSEVTGATDESKTKGEFVSPITFCAPNTETEAITTNSEKVDFIRKVKVSSEVPNLNESLKDRPWEIRIQEDEYHDSSNPTTIGIALVSNRNVIIAMRKTLSRMLFDYTKEPGHSSSRFSCSALVDVLGSFTSKDVESVSLRCILEPYLSAATASWVDRPVADQEKAFEKQALHQLTDCLPPTPLALLFATALLEQKIVLSSSRRTVLHSATVALGALMRPLKWSHLLVPLVPASLASDLLQYPAPFILGVPSQDADNMEILGSLPKDVTLVDLDVGRVILAPAFGHDNEMVRKSSDAEATAMALRSQTLYLAQALGGIFGNALRPDTWCCDSPSLTEGSNNGSTNVEKLLTVSHNVVEELLEGPS